MSLRFLDGFEHGVLSSAGGGLYSNIANFSTVADIVTSPVKTGNRCLRLRNSSRISYDFGNSPAIAMIGAWVRFEALPASGPLDIFGIESSGSPGAWVNLNTDGTVTQAAYDGAVAIEDSPNSSGTLVIGRFHWIAFYADMSSNPWVVRTKIDQNAVREYQPAIAGTVIARANIWHNNFVEAGDLTRYYDDAVIYAGSTSDWPITPKRIYPKALNAVGTHNLEAATSKFYFKDIAGTETALTTSETTSHQVIDDSPLDQDVDHVLLKGVTIQFGTSVESHTGTTGSVSQASFDISIALNARCRGVLVFTFDANANANDATSVKINPAGANIDVPAVASSLATDTAIEPGSCRAWFIGTGLASVVGTTVTVRVNRNNNANTMYAVAIAINADTDLETTGVAVQNDDGAIAELSVNDGSPGQNSMRFAGAYYGGAAPPTAGANSTLLQSIDLGAFGIAVSRETTAGQGARNVGLVGASDDRAYTVLAVRGVTPQATASHYAEYALEDTTDIFEAKAIRIISAMRQDTAAACTIDLNVFDGTTGNDIENDLNINSASNIYRVTVLTTNPSGGLWLNTIFNALKLRWGKSISAAGIPRLAALQAEILLDDVKHTPIYNRQDSQHRASRW